MSVTSPESPPNPATQADVWSAYRASPTPESFARVVATHAPLVFSVARRRLQDDHLAEDVTQAVFLILTDKAGAVPNAAALPGWLFRTTRYVAQNAARARARRAIHEHKAAQMRHAMQDGSESDNVWEQIEPALDDAVASLGATDRDAVLLRYYRRLSLREVGEQLGMTEEAARKRVARALEKLRAYFAGRGVTSMPVAALDAALVAHAAAAHVPAAVLAVGAAGASSSAAAALAKSSSIAAGWLMAAKAGVGVVLAASAVAVVAVAGGGGGGGGSTAGSNGVATPAATSPAGVTLTPSTGPAVPWRATYAQGITAEVIGIAPGHSGKQWYKPDGSPLGSVPFDSYPNMTIGNPGEPGKIRLAIRVYGVPPGVKKFGTNVTAQVDGANATGVRLVDTPDPTVGEMHLLLQMARPRQTISLQFEVNVDPWQTIGHVVPPDAGEAVMELKSLGTA